MALVQKHREIVPGLFVVRRRCLKQGFLDVARQIRPELQGGAANELDEGGLSIAH